MDFVTSKRLEILHRQIRYEVISLHTDLFNHNIVASIHYQCGFFSEDAYHYFLLSLTIYDKGLYFWTKFIS